MAAKTFATTPATASAFILTGSFVLLAGVSAYGSELYSESGTTCGSLAARIVGYESDAFCAEQAGPRRILVAALIVLGGLLLVAAAFLRTVDRAVHPVGDFSYRRALWGLATPLVLPPLYWSSLLLVPPEGPAYLGLPEGWLHLLTAVAVVVVSTAAAARADPLLRRHVAAAAAVAVPLLIAAEATLVALQTGSSRPWTQANATLDAHSGDSPVTLVTPVVVVAALSLAVLAHRRRREALTLATSAVLMSISAAVATVVLVYDLVPAWREDYTSPGSEAPGAAVWLPLLLLPVALSLAAVTVAASTTRAQQQPSTTPPPAP